MLFLLKMTNYLLFNYLPTSICFQLIDVRSYAALGNRMGDELLNKIFTVT